MTLNKSATVTKLDGVQFRRRRGRSSEEAVPEYTAAAGDLAPAMVTIDAINTALKFVRRRPLLWRLIAVRRSSLVAATGRRGHLEWLARSHLNGSLDLTPKPGAGWYAQQLFALETAPRDVEDAGGTAPLAHEDALEVCVTRTCAL